MKDKPITIPLPVPDCMRTYTKFPRIFAVTIVLIWLIIFTVGTSALARFEENSKLNYKTEDDKIN